MARRAGRFLNRRDDGDRRRHEEYREVLTSLRHYSSLRFAIAGVFIGITGFLVAALYGKNVLQAPPELGHAIRVFGLVTALVFWWIEFTLDGYLTAFGAVALRLRPDTHWAARPPLRRALVPAAMMAIHVAVVAFWIASFWWPATPR